MVIEPSSVLNGGKYSFGTTVHPIEQSEDRIGGGSPSYVNTTEEKFSDNVSSASEASETAGSGQYNLFSMRFRQGHFLKWYSLSESILGGIWASGFHSQKQVLNEIVN